MADALSWGNFAQTISSVSGKARAWATGTPQAGGSDQAGKTDETQQQLSTTEWLEQMVGLQFETFAQALNRVEETQALREAEERGIRDQISALFNLIPFEQLPESQQSLALNLKEDVVLGLRSLVQTAKMTQVEEVGRAEILLEAVERVKIRYGLDREDTELSRSSKLAKEDREPRPYSIRRYDSTMDLRHFGNGADSRPESWIAPRDMSPSPPNDGLESLPTFANSPPVRRINKAPAGEVYFEPPLDPDSEIGNWTDSAEAGPSEQITESPGGNQKRPAADAGAEDTSSQSPDTPHSTGSGRYGRYAGTRGYNGRYKGSLERTDSGLQRLPSFGSFTQDSTTLARADYIRPPPLAHISTASTYAGVGSEITPTPENMRLKSRAPVTLSRRSNPRERRMPGVGDQQQFPQSDSLFSVLSPPLSLEQSHSNSERTHLPDLIARGRHGSLSTIGSAFAPGLLLGASAARVSPQLDEKRKGPNRADESDHERWERLRRNSTLPIRGAQLPTIKPHMERLEQDIPEVESVSQGLDHAEEEDGLASKLAARTRWTRPTMRSSLALLLEEQRVAMMELCWFMFTLVYLGWCSLFNPLFSIAQTVCVRFDTWMETPFPGIPLGSISTRSQFVLSRNYMLMIGIACTQTYWVLLRERGIWHEANGVTRLHFLSQMDEETGWFYVPRLEPSSVAVWGESMNWWYL